MFLCIVLNGTCVAGLSILCCPFSNFYNLKVSINKGILKISIYEWQSIMEVFIDLRKTLHVAISISDA
jgi:hypothetical protein